MKLTGESNHVSGGESNGAETTNELAQARSWRWDVTIRSGLTSRSRISSPYFHIPIWPSKLQQEHDRFSLLNL